MLTDGTDDSDPEFDLLTVTGFTVDGFPGPYAPGATATIPGVGTLVIEADGDYTFTPVANYDGPIPAVTYTIADGNGGTDTGALTLTMQSVNDPGAITDTTTNAGNVAGSDAEVREADLATGTNPTGTAESTAGSFTIADIDGIASLTIGGTTIPLADLTAATPSAAVTIASPTYGTIAITGFDPATGTVSYTYIQDTHAPNVAGAPALDTIPLSLTDTLGNTVPGTLVIAILDDAPVANADLDRAINTAGNPSSIAIGNVATGAISAGDPNTSDGTADTASRTALMSSMKNVPWALGGVAIWYLLCGLVGAVILVVLLVLALSGKLKHGLSTASPCSGVYAESFAVWLACFVGMRYAVVEQLPESMLHLALAINIAGMLLATVIALRV
ncbi:MAG: cadherin-like domain-containing protein, partial [Verrucomicrobiae bacterium]|nr:cadherin-like domain-containing protein [Verrucomicrobiae bacterium]